MTIELWECHRVSRNGSASIARSRAAPNLCRSDGARATMMLNAGTDVIGLLRTELRRYLDDLESDVSAHFAGKKPAWCCTHWCCISMKW